MKILSLVGKVNIGLGITFFLLGIYLLIQDTSKGLSFAFILIGLSTFLSAFFYKKEEN